MFPSKGGRRRAPEREIWFPSKARSQLSPLCAAELNTVAPQPQTAAIPLPENQHIYLRLCVSCSSSQESGQQWAFYASRVADRSALACSSEPVFEFVLGEVPDRLARPTGKPPSQRGPEVQLVLGAAASTSVSGRRLPQPVFNQRLGAL